MRFFTRILFVSVAVLLCLPFVTSSFLRTENYALDRNFAQDGRGCSGFCLRNNGYALYGGNMDWNVGDRGYIYVNKRGLLKTGVYRSSLGVALRWVSKYASITFNLVCYQQPWGGMNEKGLAFSTMSLLPYTLAPLDERTPMDGPHGMQYMLDTCETIDEVIAACASLNMYMAEHYLVTDRFGNCAVMESIGGQLVFYTGDDLPVAALTNTEYEASLSTWYTAQGNPNRIQQLDQSRRRFCKAADRVAAFSSTSTDSAVAYAFDTLDTVAGELNAGHISQWRAVFDTQNLRAYFKTYHHPMVRYIDLRRLDLAGDSPVKMLEIRRELDGDVTDDLSDFEYTPSLEHMRWFYLEWGIDAPDSEIQRRMQIFTDHPYVEDDTSEAFLVSRNAEKVNSLPRTALNPDTRDVLVVWTQSEQDGSASSIRSALLSRSLTGGSSSFEEHLLSEDGGSGSAPFPIFDPNKGRFLVVWERTGSANPLSACDLLGRIVSSGGLPEGGVFKVLSNGRRNESPQAYTESVGTASKARLHLVFGSVDPAAGSSVQTGLYSSRLSRKYKAGKPRLLMPGDGGQRVLPSGLGHVAGGDLILPVEINPLREKGGASGQPAVLVIGDFKSLADYEYLGSPGASRPSLCVFQNSFGETIVVGSAVEDGTVIDKAMRLDTSGRAPQLVPVLLSTEPKQVLDSLLLPAYSESSPSTMEPAPAGKTAFGYLICAAADGKVYRRTLLERGRTGGPYKELFRHDMSLSSMFGQEIIATGGTAQDPGMAQSEYLLLWQKRLSDSEQQIRAYLIKINR
jgi:penicillin V acylase-like amidase (Ntn superfamily)